MKRIKAVFFDLYDTLTYPDVIRYKEKLQNSSRLCGVEPEKFDQVWKSLVVDSNLGKYPTTEDRVRVVIQKLGVPERPDIIKGITEGEHTFLKTGILLYDDALRTLITLRKMDLKLGLITNASPSVHTVIDNYKIDQLMDSIIISCEVGIRKPEGAIYTIALNEIGIEADRCLYVGDGNDQELDGAKKAGMTTIHIPPRKKKHGDFIKSSPEYIDYTLYCLAEIVDLLKELRSKSNGYT